MTPQILSVIAAIFSAAATAFAAFAAFTVPKTAAKLAEELRKVNDKHAESRRNKLIVFANLMENRATLASPTAVSALNLVDVVFHDCQTVRKAWAELFESFDPGKNIPKHERDTRIRRLLFAMAENLDLASDLRMDDISRIYYPALLAEENELADLERQQALARLRNPDQAISNKAVTSESIWPPAPN